VAEERLIRKYADRRLYDVTASKHINKEGVRELIVAGEPVKVVDDASGEDITRSMLMQLVSSQELGGQPVLSNEMLTQIIRYYGHPMQTMFADYLQKSLRVFKEQQESLQTQVEQLLSQGPLETLSDIAKQNMDNWLALQKSIFGASDDKDIDEDAG
jgi:polyhydroxyalkanoate synthesis repressor PhaR